MNEHDAAEVPKFIKSIWPPLLLLAFSVGVFAVAQGYSDIAKRFPSIVAGTLFVMAAIDLYSRTNLPGCAFINAFWGSGFERREMTHNPRARTELALIGWLALAFAGMAVFGILVAMPLYTFLFVWLRSKHPVKQAVIVALAVFAFEYIVFEWLLNYELYRGLIFTGDGFSAW